MFSKSMTVHKNMINNSEMKHHFFTQYMYIQYIYFLLIELELKFISSIDQYPLTYPFYLFDIYKFCKIYI